MIRDLVANSPTNFMRNSPTYSSHSPTHFRRSSHLHSDDEEDDQVGELATDDLSVR